MKFLAVIFYLCFLLCLLVAIVAFRSEGGFLSGVTYFVFGLVAIAVGDKLMMINKP